MNCGDSEQITYAGRPSKVQHDTLITIQIFAVHLEISIPKGLRRQEVIDLVAMRIVDAFA